MPKVFHNTQRRPHNPEYKQHTTIYTITLTKNVFHFDSKKFHYEKEINASNLQSTCIGLFLHSSVYLSIP